MVTATKEDYLRAIDHLEEEYQREIRSIEVANYLNLSKSTVSERLKELKDQNFIQHGKYSSVSLSKQGKEIARNLTYKHRIIETFLHSTLKLNKNKIHNEAHKLEHAFSDESINKLKNFLGNPHLDPHGQPITKHF